MDVRKLARPAVSSIKPFPAERRSGILLDSNEIPRNIPPAPMAELMKRLPRVALNRYPDPYSTSLRSRLAEHWSISADSFVIGNGSDELIQLLFNAFVASGDKVLTTVPSFSMYSFYSELFGAERATVSWRYPEIKLDIESFIDTMLRVAPKLTILDTPNNPTGQSMSNESLLRIARLCPGILVVDEAYCEFADQTFMDELRRGDLSNVCVLRTFSKGLGLAGLRVGYLASRGEIVDIINRVKSPYNVNAVSQEFASVMLDYSEWLRERIESIKYLRQEVYKEINDIPGFRALSGQGNFLLVETDYPKSTIQELMAMNNISIKFFDGLFNSEDFWFRLTIGAEEEMQILVSCLRSLESRAIAV